jgi:Fe-S-cluster-containing dehydrogenase component
MMKCDMCYDRTSTGKKPMCATVCPSQALAFMTMEEFERTRSGVATNEWQFGEQAVRTKVHVVVPPEAPAIVRIRSLGAGPAAGPDDPEDVARLLDRP